MVDASACPPSVEVPEACANSARLCFEAITSYWGGIFVLIIGAITPLT
jgi:hypothetical protein